MLAKEVVGGRGGPSGSQQVKAVAGSQVKGSTRKARKAIILGKSKIHHYPFVAKCECQNWGSLRYSNWSGLPAPSAPCAHCGRPSGAVSMCCEPALTRMTWRCGQFSMVSVKELEQVLAVEESMEEEAEMRKEKAHYDAKRAVTVRQKVAGEENEDGGEGEGMSQSEEEEDEPICGFRLSAKA